MADTIIFLMNGWDSGAGGIQTVNRELAVAVAKTRQDFRCVVVVPSAGDGEVRDAFARGVQLVHGDATTGWASALFSPEIDDIAPERVLALIGHSTFSGREAKLLRDRRFPAARLVQFVHTSPLHLEGMKEAKRNSYVAARERKIAAEIEIASAADVVVCIGPRLYRSMHDLIIPFAKPGLEVGQINCGVWRDPAPLRERPLRPTILSLGRTESIGVKGLDILAYAAGHLQGLWMDHPSTREQPAPQFIIRGTTENPEDFEQTLVAMALEVGPRPTIMARPYTSVRTDLEADYRGASIFMMPSREEGFGLVACEALSLGTPTIVSADSGVAEVLKQAARENHMEIDHCVIPIDGDPKAAGLLMARAALEILTHYPRMRGYFELLAEHMLALSSWETGARQLLELLGVETNSVAPVDASAEHIQTVRNDVALIAERSRDALLREENVISVGVEEVIVVRVSRGASRLGLPSHIDGVAVIVRESDPIQLTASAYNASLDLLIGERRSASVTLLSLSGTTRAITAAHSVVDIDGEPILVRADGDLHRASVAYFNTERDWAVLDIPSLPRRIRAFKSGSVDLGDDVIVRFDGREFFGQINVVEVTATILDQFGNSTLFHDLIMARFDNAPLVGMSGAPIISARTGAAVAMILAGANVVDGSNASSVALYCYPVEMLLGEILEREPARKIRNSRKTISIGILTTDQATLSLALEHLIDVKQTTVGGRLFFIGRDKISGHNVTICPARAAGNISAAISTLELIRFAQPRQVLVVGLGGGLDPRQIKVGDVVIASDVVYYEAGVIGGEQLPPRIQIVGKMTAHMMEVARAVAVTTESRPNLRFRILIGTVATGEKVIRDASALREMISWSRPLAVDMESAGAIEAAVSAEPEVGVVTIRGIADLADGGKRDDSRDEAAKNAVSAAFSLINAL